MSGTNSTSNISFQIPEKWLDLKLLAVLDMVLAGIAIIFQISMMGVYYGPYVKIGVGIWAGLILLGTSYLAFKLATIGLDGNMLGVTILLTGMSILCGFLLFGFNATIINVYSSNTCYSSYHWYCSRLVGLGVIVMLCGIACVPINCLLGYALIKNYLGEVKASPNVTPSSRSSPPAPHVHEQTSQIPPSAQWSPSASRAQQSNSQIWLSSSSSSVPEQTATSSSHSSSSTGPTIAQQIWDKTQLRVNLNL